MVSPSDAYRTPLARVAHVRCGYGGTGISPPGDCAIVPYFDLTPAALVSEVRAVALEVLDEASRAPIARASGPIELRVLLPGRDRDHNEITTPLAGPLDAGATVRLRAAAALSFLPASRPPPSCRYRATLIVVGSAGDAQTLAVEGPLDDPWATAGPAAIG